MNPLYLVWIHDPEVDQWYCMTRAEYEFFRRATALEATK